MAATTRIDVHAHFLPGAYLEAVQEAGLASFDGGIPVPGWSLAGALDFMGRQGVTAQVLSVPSPTAHHLAGPAGAPRLARRLNEAAAEIIDRHPTRFGALAHLPLPDVDATLSEIDHSLDGLALDGVILATNYAATYLGEPAFDPVLAELDRRGATVLLHPTAPACFAETGLGHPAPLVEFVFDVARTVTHLLYTGALARYPNLRIILPHAGGAVPALAWRLSAFAAQPALTPGANLDPDTVLAQLRSLYYDLALGANPHALSTLLEIADPGHLLFGTDYPFSPEPLISANSRSLAGYPGLTDNTRCSIAADNALPLFPHLAARLAQMARGGIVAGTRPGHALAGAAECPASAPAGPGLARLGHPVRPLRSGPDRATGPALPADQRPA
ncbi:amidohydrolase family protein [Kitasatospora sp. GP82]|uniref:amidohydrolase family protein n=1 Tax=Kitasatospora sp. GP82 TaxID=3035089 RepID=UPI002475ADCA|nr:amidohydrolase family protein [Kitasatospora sp. GP82]MDH6128102.1 putative TIM-barrel fold metal-dependent hydrolase [Kitasatospora sp. GP82]